MLRLLVPHRIDVDAQQNRQVGQGEQRPLPPGSERETFDARELHARHPRPARPLGTQLGIRGEEERQAHRDELRFVELRSRALTRIDREHHQLPLTERARATSSPQSGRSLADSRPTPADGSPAGTARRWDAPPSLMSSLP